MQRSRMSVLPHWIRLYLPPLSSSKGCYKPSRAEHNLWSVSLVLTLQTPSESGIGEFWSSHNALFSLIPSWAPVSTPRGSLPLWPVHRAWLQPFKKPPKHGFYPLKWHLKHVIWVNFNTLSSVFSSCVTFYTLNNEYAYWVISPVISYPKQGSLFSYPKQG